MIERPVIPEDTAKEQAVIESDRFLLHSGNEAFLRGNRPRPVLETLDTHVLPGIFLWVGLVVAAIGLIVVAVGLLEDTLWLLQVVVSFLCVSPFLTLGLGLWWFNRRYSQPMAGQVIHGEVVHAEKLRTTTTRGQKIDTLQVQYRFVDPHGAVITGEGSASPLEASRDMAPAPRTLVYVWYSPEGNHSLL